jgi:NAD(P)-dependent dehydrogenase (short-subunit alcohol dehydrogenase family)
MKIGLDGKVVLITGGSKGIGLACARAFAAEGARVAIASRSQENLDRARQELSKEKIEVLALRGDLSQPQDAQTIARSTEKQLGPIHVLVNSAGAARRFMLDAYNAEAWQDGMNAKYFPYVNAMDAVRPGMIERRTGSIVNIIGMGGKMAQPVFLSGGSANAALMLVTVGWASALGRYGIRVNGINPGSTLTDRVQAGIRAEAQSQGITEAEALDRSQSKIPLGRFGKPEEVAAVALFLASDQASYVTGAIIPMDGGQANII